MSGVLGSCDSSHPELKGRVSRIKILESFRRFFMQLRTKSILTATVLLVSVGLWAQEASLPKDPDLLARLSYDTSAMVQGSETRHICVAVTRDGDYRLVRSLDHGQTQRLHGKIQDKEFQQLKKLLSDSDFRALSGIHGGLIRQESESFGAEILRQDGAQRMRWLDADGESPFPASVGTVVSWLKHFEPTGGKPFEYAEYPDVCPSGGLRLLQPSVAANLP
jgi:hypothetical protein